MATFTTQQRPSAPPAIEVPYKGRTFSMASRDGVTVMIAPLERTILEYGTAQVWIANNTPFGLSAGVWTEKGSRILRMADQLRAGVVWANTFNKFDPAAPFGGYKESGYGREGGRHGLEAYLA